jgi:hypothetical protein
MTAAFSRWLRFGVLPALALAGIALSAAPAPALPLSDGEKFTFRVAWAIVPGAGEIKIAAQHETVAAQPRLIVTTTTATRRLARFLMPFDAEAKSVFDLATGQLVSFDERSKQRDKVGELHVDFDLAARKAAYARKLPAERSESLDIPEGNPTDLIMGLLQTRSWDLKPGEKRDALVLFDRDFYELTIHMARYEDVHTPLGDFKTSVLEPRMDKTPPKGMFKRGSSVRVWIAQDERRLPVKFEVEFKIGTGTATLEAYEAPAARADAAHATNPRS